MDIRELLKRAQKLTIDHSPAILTAVAVTGTVTTAYLTGRATVKAVEILNEERSQQAYQGRVQIQHHEQILLTDREKVALTWRLYIPAVSTGLLTVTCIIGANRIGTRRAAAVAAAYTLSEKAFVEYRDKVVEKLGEKKEQDLRDELAQDKVTRNPGNSSQLVIVDGKSVLCHEAYTGRYFISDMETLR